MVTPSPNGVNDENAQASSHDVALHYLTFLGRKPESDAVVRDMAGAVLRDLARNFISSGEFHNRVFLPMARGENWPWELYNRPLESSTIDWLTELFDLGDTAQAALRVDPDWHHALRFIFEANPAFRDHVDPNGRDQIDSFLTGLALAGKRRDRIYGALDPVQGLYITGWAWDPTRSDEPAEVELLVNGKAVLITRAKLFRQDVLNAGINNGICGFEAHLPLNPTTADALVVQARVAGSDVDLMHSPQPLTLSTEMRRWFGRRERTQGKLLSYLRRRLDRRVGNTLLSIVMPVYDVRTDWLSEAIESVLTQWCSRWELICIDDASTDDAIRTVLAAYAARDSRVRVIRQPANGGISKATNTGIATARGDYICFLDHDDLLEPDAVYHLLYTARMGADLIYADELLIGESADAILDPQIRPAFSWDYYLSHPYFVHPISVRTSIARDLGGFDEATRISADVDFVLRALERSAKVAHIPALLYRWRIHGGSTGHARKAEVTAATVAALNRHLSRITPGASARASDLFNQYLIDFPDDRGRTLIVIPTKNKGDLVRQCVESIHATTRSEEVIICIIDHESDDPGTIDYLKSLKGNCFVLPYAGPFNFAKMNNFAVRASKKRLGRLPPYLLFMNNDIQALAPGWIERMRSLAARHGVGVVGATLLYPNDTIQHSGVVMGLNLAADHSHKFSPFRAPTGERSRGHLGSLVSTRDYSAVTAACMLMRTKVFEAIGGFDEKFAVGFNDTDLCLRVRAKGLKVLNDGQSVLYHHESATRGSTQQTLHPEDDALLHQRWHDIIQGGDPMYSPLLNNRGISHQFTGYASRRPTARIEPGLTVLFPDLDGEKSGFWTKWSKRFHVRRQRQWHRITVEK